ncbi:MAG: hypothetical protein AMXMBFR72_27030 [Betaproteobacteria bacterium]
MRSGAVSTAMGGGSLQRSHRAFRLGAEQRLQRDDAAQPAVRVEHVDRFDEVRRRRRQARADRTGGFVLGGDRRLRRDVRRRLTVVRVRFHARAKQAFNARLETSLDRLLMTVKDVGAAALSPNEVPRPIHCPAPQPSRSIECRRPHRSKSS